MAQKGILVFYCELPVPTVVDDEEEEDVVGDGVVC